jgi:hypothetical protein
MSSKSNLVVELTAIGINCGTGAERQYGLGGRAAAARHNNKTDNMTIFIKLC